MRYGLWVGILLVAVPVGTASAFVGEPYGTFSITVTQGSDVVVANPAVPVPADIKISDGDPEDFVVIGTIGPAATPIILKVVSEDDPEYRIVHFYIDVPVSTSDIHTPGPTSLFDPIGDPSITVEISGLKFTDTAYVFPRVEPTDTFLTAFMRDEGGRFYNLPQAVTVNYPGPDTEVQVPGSAFWDADPVYQWLYVDGSEVTLIWQGLVNPGSVAATVNDGFNPDAPATGYVFELGLGVAFVGIAVPEPATVGLLLLGVVSMASRRYLARRRAA